MRTLAIVLGLLLLGGGAAGGWVALNYWAPGTIGTPAHAGAVSNGHPEDCVNASVNVRARQQATYGIPLESGDYVRGTLEADGGWGRVDIIMRLATPNNDQILQSPRTADYDFTFPAKMRGTYTVLLDNRYSLYTSKTVALFYCVERNQPRPAGAPAPLH